MKWRRFYAMMLAASLCGCAQSLSTPPTSSSEAASRNAGAPNLDPKLLSGMPSVSSSKITHVVIIVQENRTVNDLFNGLPGADTVRTAYNSQHQLVKLQPRLLTAPYDISHAHSAFTTEYAGGWDKVRSTCRKNAHCPPANVRAYGYVPQQEVQPYFTMAKQYAFASRMFQTNEGPSFPAHQYLVSGTSTIKDGSPLRASENPITPQKKLTGGCDSPAGSRVTVIDQNGNENHSAYPCFDRISLMQEIHAPLTWHYYQAAYGPGLWKAPDAVLPVYKSPEFATDVVAPSSQVLKDIAAGKLANVVWVTPTAKASDHANITDGSGPSWVASVVNKIGQSKYWNSTAIFVTWDDWGGWYDPIVPPELNSYELGFRVPLIVISPYAKKNYISTVQHEFASTLKFTEETFGLPSLGTTDVRADDLADCFDFSQQPRKFVPIPAPRDADYFLRQPTSTQNPDEDF